METKEFVVAVLAIFFLFGVPSLAWATHLVLRPLVREIAKAIGTSKSTDAELEARLTTLEESVRTIDVHLDRLLEEERFRRKLEAGDRI